MTYPPRFHLLAAIILALTAAWSNTATATDELHSANTVRVDDSAFLPVNQEHQAHTYLPGHTPCPNDYSGAVVAVGCASVVWCFHGVTKFSTTCDEGELFDDTCLCCRSTEEYSCPTALEQHLNTDGTEVEQQGGDEMSFSYDDVSVTVSQPSCPQHHSGPVVALGCASVAWCLDGSITFSTTCNEGTLFDTSCLCCRNAHEYSCPTAFEQQQEEEKDKEVVEVDNVNSTQNNTTTDGLKEEQQGDEAAMNFSYDEVTETVVGAVQEEEEEEEVYETVVPDKTGFDDNDSPPSTASSSFLPTSLPTATPTSPLLVGPRQSWIEWKPDGDTITCPDGYTGLLPSSKCKATTVCRDGTFVAYMNCPEGTLFDSNINSCVKEYEGFVCGGSSGDGGDDDSAVAYTRAEQMNDAPETARPSTSPSARPSTLPTVPSPTSIKVPTVPPNVCPQDYTGLQSANECKAYSVCNAGVFVITLDCPAGSLFDDVRKRCVEGFVCGGDAPASGVSSASPSTLPSASPTSEPSSTPSVTPIVISTLLVPNGMCPRGYTGLAAIFECKSVNVCRDGKYSMTVDCPTGTRFDVRSGRCTQWSLDFICGGGTEADISVVGETDGASNEPSSVPTDKPTQEVVVCPPGYDGFVPTADCRGTVVCNNGIFLLGPIGCPGDTLFDSDNGFCTEPYEGFVCDNGITDPPSNAPSVSPSTQPSAEPSAEVLCPPGYVGLAPAAGKDCTAYNICKDGVVLLGPAPCPNGTLLDVSKQQCDYPSNEFVCGAKTTETLSETSEEAPSRAPSTAPSTAPSETPKCPKGFTGLVPASKTCKAAIFCQGGVYRSGPVSCPGDSVFDFSRQSCITPSAEFSCDYYLMR